MTTTYDAYKAEATAKIKRWEAELKEIEDRLSEAGADAREECCEMSQKARSRLDDVKRRLAEMSDASREKATAARAYADAGMEEINRLYGSIKSKL